MPKFRNVSDDERYVGYGLPRAQNVAPDELIDVQAEVVESYACQPDIWAPVDAEAHGKSAAKTTPKGDSQ